MVPLRDDNPTERTPYVTYALIALNLLAFGYELSLGGEALDSLFRHWAVVPLELTAEFQGIPAAATVPGTSLPEWSTLITSQFLHGGWLHLLGNMLFLWIFGNNVEDRLGPFRFVLFYLACGVLANLCQWYFAPFSEVPSLGASGAIAGVMGAYILRYPTAAVLTLIPLGFIPLTVRVPAFAFLGFWFVQQALYGLASLEVPANIGMGGGGVAYWAHAGGFAFGAILGPLLGLLSDVES